MRQFFGMSNRGDLSEAVRNLDSPQFIMLLSNNAQFEEHVKALEKLYPGIPSIGCIGMSYDTKVVENGVGIIAFSGGVSATANVLEQVSTMPVKYIHRLEPDIRKINGSKQDTVCIDFCSGNDACVLTTLYTSLRSRGIQLVGGTGDGGKVSANGKVYEDSVAYALVRNQNGRVKTYKENIYHQMGNYRFIASNTDRANYIPGLLPAGERLRCAGPPGAGRLSGHRGQDHSGHLPGLPQALRRLLRELPVPLQTVHRAALHGHLPAGDGKAR